MAALNSKSKIKSAIVSTAFYNLYLSASYFLGGLELIDKFYPVNVRWRKDGVLGIITQKMGFFTHFWPEGLIQKHFPTKVGIFQRQCYLGHRPLSLYHGNFSGSEGRQSNCCLKTLVKYPGSSKPTFQAISAIPPASPFSMSRALCIRTERINFCGV